MNCWRYIDSTKILGGTPYEACCVFTSKIKFYCSLNNVFICRANATSNVLCCILIDPWERFGNVFSVQKHFLKVHCSSRCFAKFAAHQQVWVEQIDLNDMKRKLQCFLCVGVGVCVCVCVSMPFCACIRRRERERGTKALSGLSMPTQRRLRRKAVNKASAIFVSLNLLPPYAPQWGWIIA